MRKEDVDEFVSYVKDNLVGDEKGQAQLFCDRLFRAFGHKGIFEADGNLEVRVKESETEKTKFIDCLESQDSIRPLSMDEFQYDRYPPQE